MMNRIGYEIEKGVIPEYVLQIASSGVCPQLCKISSFSFGESYGINYSAEGMTSFRKMLEAGDKDDFVSILIYLRAIFESAKGLSDYLIYPQYISFSLDKILFDDKKHARFLIKPSESDYVAKVLNLLNEIDCSFPGRNADLIASRIAEENAKQLLSFRQILSILSAWQMELR